MKKLLEFLYKVAAIAFHMTVPQFKLFRRLGPLGYRRHMKRLRVEVDRIGAPGQHLLNLVDGLIGPCVKCGRVISLQMAMIANQPPTFVDKYKWGCPGLSPTEKLELLTTMVDEGRRLPARTS